VQETHRLKQLFSNLLDEVDGEGRVTVRFQHVVEGAAQPFEHHAVVAANLKTLNKPNDPKLVLPVHLVDSLENTLFLESARAVPFDGSDYFDGVVFIPEARFNNPAEGAIRQRLHDSVLAELLPLAHGPVALLLFLRAG
jgi:hypothetical protein